MFSNYKPTWMVEAIYQITPEQLKAQGIKAVLTDLDNTLIAWDNPNGTEELHDWLQAMKAAGIPVIVVSNNSSDRVARALATFELDFIARALKPFSFGIKNAVNRLGVTNNEAVMVGDQLMTDIKAANAARVRTILVKPIVPTDNWKTRINRFFERRIMNYLTKHNPKMIWRGELSD
ncbi:MAG: YqeG family HAD IIIA-type phosphatase [Enterococcus sp.]